MDAPNVPEPDPTPQRQANTAPPVHRSKGKAKATPILDQSSQVADPPARSSFPNIHVPHEVRSVPDNPGQFSVTLSVRSTQRFLGMYPIKIQAHFAVQVAILLDQILTQAQRTQQDIILEPDQSARLKALEREYDFDGNTKDEIKDEVALHLLDSHQEIIWTRPANQQPPVRQTIATMADELHRTLVR